MVIGPRFSKPRSLYHVRYLRAYDQLLAIRPTTFYQEMGLRQQVGVGERGGETSILNGASVEN